MVQLPAIRPEGAIQRVLPTFFLGLVLMLPPAFAYLVPGVGFVGGTMIVSMLLLASCVVGLTRYPAQVSLSNVLFVLLVITFLVIAHFTAAMYARATLTPKTVSSVPLLLIEAIAIPAAIGCLFIDARHQNLWLAGRMVRLAFLFSAILGATGLSPPTESVGAKPLFPFTEPSYWGYTFVPILVFTSVRARLVPRMVWLGIFVALTLVIENWTMLLCCLMALAVSVPKWTAIPAGLALAGLLVGIDISYYIEHLDFDISSTESQSALVYVQGWQMLEESLRRSVGWGLGFQQMGYQYTAVPATFRINAIWGYDLNLQDGGFLMAKIGSEFGIIGLAGAVFTLILGIRAFFVLRGELVDQSMSNPRLLAYSSCYGILLEMFVRGGNYFSGTLMLYLASLVFLTFDRSREYQLWHGVSVIGRRASQRPSM